MYVVNKIDKFHPANRCKHEPSRVHFIFCLLITALLCLTAATNTASAATYYVDAVSGDDSNPGTSAEPWQTTNKVIAEFRDSTPGTLTYDDHVKFRNGNYGTFSLTEDTDWEHWTGSMTDEVLPPDTKYLYIEADTGHTPVFTGILLGYVRGTTYYKTAVIFDGIYLKGSINIKNSIGAKFRNMEIEGNSYEDTAMGIVLTHNWDGGHHSNDIEIDNCTIHHWGIGVYAYCSNLYIHDCNIYDIGHDHLKIISGGLGTKNIVIEDNEIHHSYVDPGTGTYPPGWHPDGLQIQWGPMDGVYVRRNKFYDLSCQGISPDGVQTNLVFENNLFYRIPAREFQTNGDGVIFRNNTIIGFGVNLGDDYGVAQVKFSAEASNYNVYNNIIFAYYSGDPIDSPYHDYNIYIRDSVMGDSEPNSSGYANSAAAVADFPNLFVDPDNDDYRLKSGSLAIDFGDPVHAPATDILGVSRVFPPDASCYEYIPSDSNNQAPTADAGSDQTVTDADSSGSEQVTLDGSGSTDSDGTIQSYVWSEGGSQIATGVSPNVTLSTGQHTITLTVTDDDSATDTDTVTITINEPANQAPAANAGSDQTVTDSDGNGSQQIALDGSGSTDSDGTIQSYVWSEGGTQITTGVSPNVTLSTGQHTITLTVTDDDSATDTDTVTITINEPANQAPTANAGSDQTVTDSDGNGSQQITLDGSGSTDTDGTIQSYVWSEGGTQIATGVSPNVTLSTGQHTIILTVTDNDGATDTDTVTVTINALDTTAPSVTNYSPASDAIQVPLNNLVVLHIVDAGRGVDANLVTIQVNDNTVYTGNTADYSSDYGHCRRTGTKADYTFIYQSNEMFDFDRTVTVTVNATDLANNTMNEYSYSFDTEMRSFGENKKVNSGSDGLSEGGAVTVPDSSGNIWAAWHAGPAGSRDIYVGKLTTGADNFGNSIQLTDNTADQYNAAIAVDADDKLYVVWQDNRQGNWDIYLSTSTDGINWSTETRITDSNDNQTNPGIVIDSSLPRNVYIVWQDDRNGNQDIYAATSSNGFLTETISQITSDSSDQTEPAIAVDSGNVIYVVWTDTRGGSSNIYGAASNSGPWTNVAIVSNANNQSSPAIATEAVGSILHLLWVDDTSGDQDIYYAASNGLPGSPLSGSSIIDNDTSGSNQSEPVIVVTGSTGDNLKVFACWQDTRDSDKDLYLDEITSSSGTDVFVGDDSTNTDQSEPAMGTDIYGHPYLIWVDNRNTNADIYYAGSTFTGADVLAAENVSPSTGATVGTEPSTITGVDDVSVVVPAGAYSCDITITISRVENPPSTTLQRFSLPYDFGPSGIEFDQPVTITIPYEVPASGYSVSAYWYNQLTGMLSQQGITNVETIVISPTLYALSFKTTHFTQFFVGGSSSADSISGGGGGGGGCSISAAGEGSIVEFLLPYIGLAVVMVVIKCRDVRNCKARSIT